MEFFAEIDIQAVTAEQVCELITIARLPELCASIDSVVSIQSERIGEIYCVWGQFQVSRERIRNGVRIALLNCPHALAWTVAAKTEESVVVVHCTIDDAEAENEFIESIEEFVNDWKQGLTRVLPKYA
ncbi:hypothetical protein [Thiorhodococcus drewsii]|uniref:hypothetical protein n=1 Tax=Thiorhodococcus drewsii TaxID=210408 RepID=UPI000592EE20|nr:hypothetical protein [Thiorhodococcus drewsii]